MFLVAGTVGGILANSTRPAEFIYDNLMIHATVVHAAHLYGVEKLLYLGSSCIYPRECAAADPRGLPAHRPARADQRGLRDRQDRRHQALPGLPPAVRIELHLGDADQPLRPGRQLRPPELARAAGADAQVPRRRSCRAARGRVWGTGSPRREFLHVDDLADACLFLMRHYDEDGHINVGTGEDLSIRELAETIARGRPPGGDVVFDTTKPDGTPRKLLDVRACTPSAGATAPRSQKASRPPIGGSSTTRRSRAGCSTNQSKSAAHGRY